MEAEATGWRGGWLNRLVARPGFQRWASTFPLTRGRARRDGAALFDVVQGFVKSQVLMALVELDVFRRLRAGPQTAEQMGRALDIPADRMQVLLQAGAALGLLKRRRGGRYGLARQGAALMGVPGLEAMIRHHRAFYRDLEDPVALLRGPERTELSEFWPYVFGARGDVAPDVARTYSDLMAQSQQLVAQDTLRAIDLKCVTRLLDIGGGTGAFLEAVGAANPGLDMVLFDLPQVVPDATDRFARAGLADRVRIEAGSFREDSLPEGADAISLIRVLYDHADDTVEALLSKVFDALPGAGRLIISEPMAGGAKPEIAGDVYFAFYTMAMQTGRARSAKDIAAFCRAVGFEQIRSPAPSRAFVTRVLTAVKPK
ncbi:methyltransferase [Aestuariivita sp.]|jgi:demethylspheroidene O-methyltransferase|uniref:methyltransferase n=1 Tax=Aestuariivita sp. TaxID=1872407 RepID=UPI00216E40AF|nr:methyltransferase [Aestuariivita sp.]MCE8007669.1 methyltransferase domain-containing protein [Aestuariivita sp.]